MWQHLTPAQGTVLGSFITFAAAIIGVFLGAKIFDLKANTFKKALDRSGDQITDHVEKVQDNLSVYEEKLNEQLASLAEQVGKISGTIAELPSQSNTTDTTAVETAKTDIRASWITLRDRLERIAADPAIDGRTRAKYGRIDRRSYSTLVDALDSGGVLQGKVESYRNAVNLWARFRSGRATPTEADLTMMRGYEQETR